MKDVALGHDPFCICGTDLLVFSYQSVRRAVGQPKACASVLQHWRSDCQSGSASC
jgi:hypothetical protein